MTEFQTHSTKTASGTCIIALSGYLDAHTATDFERSMQRAVDENCTNIVVDFAELEYISSAGLGVFMVFVEPIRSLGGDIKLAAMSEKVFSVFDLLGFPTLFNIFPTVDEAVKAFEEK